LAGEVVAFGFGGGAAGGGSVFGGGERDLAGAFVQIG
jgi:hypothetical protein